MTELIRCYKAEWLKRKNSIFFWLHILLPCLLVAGLTFLLYNRKELLNVLDVYRYFFVAMSCSFPLVIAVVCGLMVEQEAKAGDFQYVLGKTKNKIIVFVSQLLLLISMCIGAVFIGILSLIISLRWLLNVDSIHYILLLKIGLYIVISVVFLYCMHFLVSYIFGIGISSMVGFFGFVVAALSETSLGDRVWYYLPWGWAIRFSNYFIYMEEQNASNLVNFQFDIQKGSYTMMTMTMVCIIISTVWFYFWEGNRSNE